MSDQQSLFGQVGAELRAVARAAVLSPDGVYRYTLSRSWGGTAINAYDRFTTFVMLNPSTANAEVDDPTIRKCVAYAELWGYTGLRVVNLYAFRATDPAALKSAGYPVGPDNQQWLDLAFKSGNPNIICAWGAHAQPERGAEVLKQIREAGSIPYALNMNKDGSPSHPLYLPLAAVPFVIPEAA